MEESVRLKPDYAEARVDYARVLTDLNRPAEAEKQAKLAVDADPRSAAGHEIWGSLCTGKGDLSGSMRELSEAVRLQPGIGARKSNWGSSWRARATVPALCSI